MRYLFILFLLFATPIFARTNIAPDGTASGSITGSPSTTVGLISHVNDDVLITKYGFQEYAQSKTFVLTAEIDLGADTAISGVAVVHQGATDDFGELPNSADYSWVVSTKPDGGSYSTFYSGNKSLGQQDSFDQTDAQDSNRTVRYVKIVTNVTSSIPQVYVVAVEYLVNEIKIWDATGTAAGYAFIM